ncbi:MAG: helix-turn-helix domain-containing protein [Bacteroidetes bacterium]|nr:helix-turn-helix domain-containing protein [Bacteroidota bacterium]
MVERLELLLKTKSLSPAQLADEIQVQRSGIYHIMKGRNKPGLDFITKLLEHFPDISSEWLILGKGPMIKRSDISMVEEPTINAPGKGSRQDTEKTNEREFMRHTAEKLQKSNKGIKKDAEKQVDKIVIFYTDSTFQEYLPK